MTQTDNKEELGHGFSTYEDLVAFLVEKTLVFADFLSDQPLRPYQVPFAYRIIESVLLEDVANITALFARQSGKTEAVANIVAALLILLPIFAKLYPDERRLTKFKKGFWVGMFAPTEEQAETLFDRLKDRLTSERARGILGDPEIELRVDAKSTRVRLSNGSRVLKMTANPKAHIESKTFHFMVVDEAQDVDDLVVEKSIMPMRTATAGTFVRTGTPNTKKGHFKRTIDQNKRRHANMRGVKQDNFEADWKVVAKCSPEYAKAIAEDMERLGEESDAFQMSYCLKWLIDRGMFTTDARFAELGDTSMQELVKTWTKTPVVVGIDPARTTDSTVVTVCFVDWDRPDEFGLYVHRVLNWLELQNTSFETQYAEIIRFLDPYNIYRVSVDAQGMGSAVAERLGILLRYKNCEVIPLNSTPSEQNKRWKHLQQLMDKGYIGWPAGAKVRRLKAYKKFEQQMIDAEKHYQGPNIMVRAPEENNAHDDYVDSLALACYNTADISMPQAEQADNPFYAR